MQGARRLLEEAVAIRRQALGPGNFHVARALDDLAKLLRAMGDSDGACPLIEEAVPIYRAALASREKALGADHTGTRQLRATLADVLCRAGRESEARASCAGTGDAALIEVGSAARGVFHGAGGVPGRALGAGRPSRRASAVVSERGHFVLARSAGSDAHLRGCIMLS